LDGEPDKCMDVISIQPQKIQMSKGMQPWLFIPTMAGWKPLLFQITFSHLMQLSPSVCWFVEKSFLCPEVLSLVGHPVVHNHSESTIVLVLRHLVRVLWNSYPGCFLAGPFLSSVILVLSFALLKWVTTSRYVPYGFKVTEISSS